MALISVLQEMLLCLHLLVLTWLGGLAGVAGVITNQGMGWGSGPDSELEENEVREFAERDPPWSPRTALPAAI